MVAPAIPACPLKPQVKLLHQKTGPVYAVYAVDAMGFRLVRVRPTTAEGSSAASSPRPWASRWTAWPPGRRWRRWRAPEVICAAPLFGSGCLCVLCSLFERILSLERFSHFCPWVTKWKFSVFRSVWLTIDEFAPKQKSPPQNASSSMSQTCTKYKRWL